MAQPAASPPPAAEHNSFGKVAIKLGYITEGQLEEAMKVQATAAKAGLRKRLGEILIKKGYLTPEQFQEVLKSQTVKSKRIGAYELMSKLGEGGMGSVFKARQVFMDRVIALKILSPKMAKNKDFRERFVREARAVAKLNHPNIVAGIDVGSADGYCYFAMEFVDGESLGQYMQRKGGKLDEATALEFVRQAAMALHHAHQNNLLHRDVKPDNLLLDKERNIVKLADLGLARSAESAEDDAALTQAGQAVGTPFYISPEQARGLSDLTPATDIYSLGASLFHLLTGHVPFDGPTAAVIMTRHLTDPVPSLRKHVSKISEETEKMVFHCMEKKPEDRYTDAMDLISAIERIQSGSSSNNGSNRTKNKGTARSEREKDKDRGDRGERGERSERSDRSDRNERVDRSERSERNERSDRSDRNERAERNDREKDRERERDRDKERERERARERARAADADDDEDDDVDADVEREKRTTNNVGTRASVSATRSIRRSRSGGGVGGFLVVVLLLIGAAAALYFLKPELFKGKAPAVTPGEKKPDDKGNAPVGPAPFVAPAVPAKVSRAADGSLTYKADFENDFSAFDVDPTLLKAGDGIQVISDGDKARTNHVLKMAKIRSMGDPAAGSMVRLSLPADLQLSAKAAIKFKICVTQSSDGAPEIQVYWDNMREGAGARALCTWSQRIPESKDAWVDVTVLLAKMPNRLKSRVALDKPQYIEIMAGKPDDQTVVFIDEIELTDSPLGGGAANDTPKAAVREVVKEAPIAPAPPKKEAPIAPAPAKREPPVAPAPGGKKEDAADALQKAM